MIAHLGLPTVTNVDSLPNHVSINNLSSWLMGQANTALLQVAHWSLVHTSLELIHWLLVHTSWNIMEIARWLLKGTSPELMEIARWLLTEGTSLELTQITHWLPMGTRLGKMMQVTLLGGIN